MKHAPGALRLAAAAVIGGCWSLGTLGVALSPALVWLWRTAGSRTEALAVVALYQAAVAAKPLWEIGAQGYQGVATIDLVQCAVASAAFVGAVWACAWSSSMQASRASGALRTACILTVMALPGIGVLGLAHPLTAAGLWLAGAGWLGLLLHGVALVTLTGRARTLSAWACVAVVIAMCRVPAAEARSSRGAADLGVRTTLPGAALADFGGQLRTATGAQAAVTLPKDSLVVLGEGLAGLWSKTMRCMWEPLFARAATEGATVIVGATQATYDAEGSHYEAVAIVQNAAGHESIVRQRVPMPFLLWRPWQPSGYVPHWLESGTVDLSAGRAGILICYEQLLVFPVLLSMHAGAAKLIGLANVHELGGATVARWQQASMRAWASLFGVPVVLAVNE